jgi:hypothetical protein
MSRYHPVRPKKHKQEHENTPQPAAPEPAREQAERTAREQFRAMYDNIYRIRDGEVLDAAIERWKDTLAVYDQERAAVKAKNGEGHRWTISPTIALRVQMYLEKLLERREQLKKECHAEALERMERMTPEEAANSSLCQPKQPEPASVAGRHASLADPRSAANPAQTDDAQGGPADAVPRAA